MTGFYLMHRGWQDNPMFGREPHSRRDAWVWLIEHAAFKDTRVGFGNKSIAVARGQLCYSLRYLAKAWGWDDARVRRFIARAEVEKMITCVADAGQTVITICNYDTYQTTESVADAPTDAATTQERRGDDANKKEGKEDKEVSKEDSDANASAAAPPEPPISPIDLKRELWRQGKAFLGQHGIPPPQAGSLLGAWRKDFGDAVVIDVLARADAECVSGDVVAYIVGCLKRRGENGQFQAGRKFTPVESLYAGAALAIADREAQRQLDRGEGHDPAEPFLDGGGRSEFPALANPRLVG